MATIKSYTDINQSLKLAEILPLESADMHYSKNFEGSWFVDLVKYTSVKIPKYVDKVEEHLLPCWSLGALFSLLPLDNLTMPQLIGTPKTLYRCMYDDDFKSHAYDNPIDACYEMILKSHERKLL